MRLNSSKQAQAPEDARPCSSEGFVTAVPSGEQVGGELRHAVPHCAAHAQACLEKFAHGYVVQAITAVEDDTLLGQRLGQVLGGLSLPGACMK